MLAGECNLSRAGCLKIESIDMTRKRTGVVQPWIFHLIVGFVKHLSHIWAEHCPPLLTGWIPAPAVRTHQLELWKVASCDWIKKDYMIKEVPGSLIKKRQMLIYNWCQHFCDYSCHRLSFAAALWCHRCELKMNLHLRCWHYDTIEWTGRKPWVNIECCVGYGRRCGMGGVVLCKSRDVESVQDAGPVLNCEGCVECRSKRASRCRREEGICILKFLLFGSYPAFCPLIHTKWLSIHLAQPPGPSWMRSLETRFSTRREESLRHWAQLWYLTSLLPLRNCESWSKLFSSEVIPNLKQSNMATNT